MALTGFIKEEGAAFVRGRDEVRRADLRAHAG
jgi:hypothetical protein